jgi:acetoacetyl-CoA reductase/3-oxoacyl-[acyl-carrier protein] reductase
MHKNEKVDDMSVVTITGGTRGLGAAITKHMMLAGHNVVMNYRSEQNADKIKNEISALKAPGQLLAIEADVRNRSDVQNMFSIINNKFGQADVLINCAGVNRDAKFLEMTDTDWDVVVDTHLKGTFICAQEFAKQIRGFSGNIINLGAACGIQGRLNGSNFCSAKGGILALTKCMARELAPLIRVNCLTPSAVDTEEVRERYNLDNPIKLKNLLAGIPMQRLGKHNDVTNMVDCILSAKFTTGENFFVNGGEFMH